ncbi:SDR family NAD(P)-dependent oxidoreductase [Anoxynatronum buryatiense]|uniref:3-oxoacyl-[acyl-carrier protein] reductase/meso-butanediol dehydrogenase / (S,S)-butanediol dehydrogenase / diacetyl reductase/2-hydroxycyclohexanecarboxyl-CoA dehydrogenase n=1 Tax=Anoxynatronum buryatiense TaxID=489973 RepID=A0AA45WUD7_9CLOT|nr:SDR family oxidoreductase [Anoxynatronum buryatiense]SMP45647.1 3-oxoacyl-[acyl-carrier protein] reductase/meso-butanediol dehydrogenase / (S,S)-butanediol dehydrogenase / diacetyl reductase/2-hydroxycyclohexanecarboxyl-CoA dehydrogenase [Anoxynatronum buryatiense]
MKIDLEGQTAIVTGAGGDIGAGIVEALAKCGANVAVTDLDMQAAQKVVFSMSAMFKGEYKAYQLDVSEQTDIKRVFSKICKDFGTIEILVAGAACAGEGKNYFETPMETARKIADVNIHGTGMCIKEALTYMLPQKYGKIITISSVAGREGTAGTPNYSISKAAMIALTQSVAKAHAKEGISANSVCPGYLLTNMWKKGIEKYSKILGKTPEETWQLLALDRMATGRAQEPADIGNAVAFLVSDLAKNITGQALNVCGGAKFN